MKKLIGAILSILILAAALKTVALAASKPVDINLGENLQNCVFTIQWENTEQTAEVEIVSPSGDKFGTLVTPDRVTVSEGRLYINVGNASAGKWIVNITAQKLGKVDIWAGELPGSMTIDLFKVEVLPDSGYRAVWNVSDCPEDIYVEIYADKDIEGYDGEKVVYTASEPTGETTFQLSSLENGTYFFYIKVFIREGLFSYAYNDTPFKYEDPYSPEKLSRVQAGLLNGDVYLSWEGSGSTYKVMLFSADTKELIFEETTQDSSLVLPMPKGADEVLAGVASYDGNRLGKYDLYKVNSRNLPEATVAYPSESATNQTVVFADVAFTGDYSISAILNGELLLEKGDEPGKYQINLREGDNTIVFLVSDDDGNTRTFLKEIYLDSTPPQLAVNKDINHSSTGDSYIIIEGYTEAGALLYCNDQPVELVNNYFSFKTELALGKNNIVISAKDVAGNETRYSAAVRRVFLTGTTLRWIVLGLVGLALAVLEIVILLKGIKRRKHESA